MKSCTGIDTKKKITYNHNKSLTTRVRNTTNNIFNPNKKLFTSFNINLFQITNFSTSFNISATRHETTEKADWKVTRPGITTGASFMVFANLSDYFIRTSASDGFTIYLHDPEEPARMEELGLKLSIGQFYSISYDILNITRLQKPYGECSSQNDYSQVRCEIEHEKLQVVKECGCRLYYMPGNEPECDFYTERFCALNTLNEHYLNMSMKDEDKYCPLKCNQITYKPSITASPFSEHYLKNILPQVGFNYSYKYFKENFIYITLYVTAMFYTKMSIIPAYSFSALMSDIGGSMSLVLGATLLTVVELTEMMSVLISYLIIKCRMAKNRKCDKRVIPTGD